MVPPTANVRRAAIGARRKIEGFPTEVDMAMQFLKWAAEGLEAAHDEEKVATLREAVVDMAALQEKLRLHVMALNEVEIGRLTQDEGSFADVLHKRTLDMAAQDPRAPEDHEAVKAFNKAVWDVHHRDELMPGEEEEDIIMTSKDLVANAACPLSGKAVDELTEPVCAKECRHIYEAENARAYYNRGRKGCGVAGCNKELTLNSFISDSKLLRDLQELKRSKRGGAATQVEDYTALDDED